MTYIKTYPNAIEMSDFFGFYSDEIEAILENIRSK